jgi:carbon-monoxide dehydrogenase large subunit/6-hydroxypseudooxynicotine dehydrogenase subunit gamma
VRVSPDPGDLFAYLQPVLARGHVRYVGEPVAVVVADDPYLAEDGADLVAVDYAETRACPRRTGRLQPWSAAVVLSAAE